ncbi:MAG: hypothetical protein Q9207_008408 [Kuettlingeria erythrocarpa]
MRFGATALLLGLSFLPSPIRAIFADEAYQVDFHHVLLGAPQQGNTILHRPSPTSKASLLYTLSDRSVLGAVNPRDGSVLWRQQLRAGNGFLRPAFKQGSIITASNGTVRAWDAAEGRLVWDWSTVEDIEALEVSQSHAGSHGVYVLTRSTESEVIVRKLSQDTGSLIWEYYDGSGQIPYGLSISAHGIYLVSLSTSAMLQGARIKVTSLDPSDGTPSNIVTLNTGSDVVHVARDLSLKSSNNHSVIIWTDRTRDTLQINVLGTDQVFTTRLSNEQSKHLEALQIYSSSTKEDITDIVVHCKSGTSHWAAVYHIDVTSEAIKKAYQLPAIEAPVAFSMSDYGGQTYLIRTTKHDVALFSLTSGQHLGQWSLQPKAQKCSTDVCDITYVVSEVVARGNSSFAVRSAVLLSSGDWKMIHNGEESWYRPESLSGVIAASWASMDGRLSLADELAAERHTSIGAAYLHRMKRHVRDAKRFSQWIQGLPKRIAHGLFGSLEYLGSPKDNSGFHKLIIAATDLGRIFALDVASSGKVLWSVQASVVEPGQAWAVESIEVTDDVALVRTAGGGRIQISVTRGNILAEQHSAGETDLKYTVTVPDMSGSAMAVNIKADGTVALTQPGQSTLETVIVTKDKDMTVRGWVLGLSEPLLAWTFVPQLNERIVTIAGRSSNDPVASIGKALGDRNVLYKYLSQNLLVIGTINTATSSASFYVVDSGSGQTLHTMNHPAIDITQPINCVVSENWFAYTVFSDIDDGVGLDSAMSPAKQRGYQIVVSELFESSIVNDRGPLDSTSNASDLRPRALDTDIHDKAPYVVSQTYLVPAAISFMTVTSTLQGITPRSILCVVPSLNSLFAIPRAIADPRRPTGRDATSVEAEEGLFRHDAALEFEPKWALNHMREIQGVQKVVTSPSLLESTSSVFAFGRLDMFGTRVAPIGAFDMLGKGFNKIQLIGTVVALAVGTGILAPLVRKKQTDSGWKGA